MGTPVISTNCKSGPSEVLSNGKYGRLIELGDMEGLVSNIIEILKLPNSEVCDIMNKGYERAKFFNVNDIVLNINLCLKMCYN